MESVKMEQLSLDCVKQYKVIVPDEFSKIKLIAERIMLYGPQIRQVIMYVRAKKNADMLREALAEFEMDVSIIHGELTQEDRDEMLMLFNTRCHEILVTTDDLAQEGVDKSRVNLVVNFDLPIVDDSSEEKEPDTNVYLQRFCSDGAVFNILCGDTEKMLMEKIERRLHHAATEVPSWTSYKDVRSALSEAGLGVRVSP